MQQRTYSFLVGFIREKGYSPTVREIQTQFGYKSSNSVVSHLKNLEKSGYITKSSSKEGARARTMKIVDDILGTYTIETEQLKVAIRNLKGRGYSIDVNEAIELLTALKIGVV